MYRARFHAVFWCHKVEVLLDQCQLLGRVPAWLVACRADAKVVLVGIFDERELLVGRGYLFRWRWAVS